MGEVDENITLFSSALSARLEDEASNRIKRYGKGDPFHLLDFGMIVSIIIPILLEQLSGCLFSGRTTKEELVNKLNSNSPMVRALATIRVRRALSEMPLDERIGVQNTSCQVSIRDCILQTLTEHRQEVVDMASESDWTMGH